MAAPSVKIGGYDVPHEHIVATAKNARCDDFITALPDGYNTVIGAGLAVYALRLRCPSAPL